MPATVHTKSAPGPWLAALEAASDDDLVRLLASRPELALAGPSNLAELADRLVSPDAAAAYFGRADRSSRQVLEVLSALGSPATTGSVARALGCATDALAPLLDALRAGHMLLASGEEVTVNPGLVRAIEHPCALGPPAAGLLGHLTNHELAAMATRLGLPGHGAKPALVARISAALGDAEQLAALLRAAPERAADVLEMAGRQWPRLHLSYGVAEMARQPASPLGWCLQRGLLVGVEYSTAVMPREVGIAYRRGRLVASFSPDPPACSAVPIDQEATDREAAEAASTLVADVASLCEAWSAAPAKLLQAGGLGIREVRRVAKAIGRTETATARLIELAGVAGLVDVDDSGALVPTVDYDRWLTQSSSQRWIELASTWLTVPVHLGVAGAEDRDDKPLPPLLDRPLEPAAVLRRVQILGLLATVGEGAAFDAADLCAQLDWRHPGIWDDDPAPTEVVVGWFLDEARLLGVTAGGGLSRFGRQLACGDPDAAERALAELAPPVVSEVIIQGDLTATVAGEAAPHLRAELDLLANVESSGHATVWRFSDATVRRGFEAGRSAAQILAFLTEHATRGVPQPLAYLVEDLGRRYGQVRVGTAGCYVRSDDPALLAEILRSKKTIRLGLRAIAPTVAVTTSAAPAVLEALRAAGYLPAGEEPDGTLTVRRPPARRAGAATPASGVDVGDLTDHLDLANFGLGFDDDFDDDDFDDDESAEALLAQLLDAPEALSAMTGLAPELAGLFLAAAAGGGLPGGDEDIPSMVRRLRAAPPPPAAAPRPEAPTPLRPRPSPFPQAGLFENRPTHIVKESRALVELLQDAWHSGWPVRIGYVNTQGVESELSVEILGVGRGDFRVRYLAGRPGGARLATYRVQWARVLTEAEERGLR